MAERRLPKLGDFASARCCSRFLGYNEDGSENVCGKPPILHVIWEETVEGFVQGWVCGEHATEIGKVWEALAAHEPGAACGMPGSVYVPAENRCECEDIPTAEPLRTVAVAVGSERGRG